MPTARPDRADRSIPRIAMKRPKGSDEKKTETGTEMRRLVARLDATRMRMLVGVERQLALSLSLSLSLCLSVAFGSIPH